VPGRKELNAQHPFRKLQVARIWNAHPAGACGRVVLSMVAPYFPSSVRLYEYGQKLNTSTQSARAPYLCTALPKFMGKLISQAAG
jgi:hypothetical protein